MKSYEKESLFKNFLVFFSLLEILLILLFSELYRTEKTEYHQDILKTMQVCSYSFECEQFHFDFVPKEDNVLNKLYEKEALYAFFHIPKSKKFYVKISYPLDKLYMDIKEIQKGLWIKFILATILLMGVALFFTFYSLKPIRKALRLNDEFIKDILHDFNTPITSMLLNIKMFKDEIGENPFVERLSHSIDTLLLLQNNLKSFLHNSPSQKSSVDVGKLAQTRLKFIQNIYPKLTYEYIEHNDLVKTTNQELLTRIFDNLISNAAKYNKPHGKVTLTVNKTSVVIEDTGKGIQDVERVLQRYYKEQDRGIGLGLPIVQKLTRELNIILHIESYVGKGTKVILDFKHLHKGEK
ncbi:HAMP domain-containing sensor histidine kinase [Sulfurovum sp. zt1-1]|uniref:histidine kinase n=1 Tax=Sulfurovum zhangzhouensis TaxID=3019067 RepID=A0ABT7QYY6_9BACT|nr:HAMP domain-containing sensor histidine kinase [Sulfurovum zhangzhouensis]MDM5271981.1 HAMP domain-containing sensor histidine kinase [Sulfurovum zhangzhouensis]